MNGHESLNIVVVVKRVGRITVTKVWYKVNYNEGVQ